MSIKNFLLCVLSVSLKIDSSRYQCLIGCHSEAKPKNLFCISIGKADASLSLSRTSMRMVVIVFSFSAGELKLMNHSAMQFPIPGFADEARKNIASPGRVNQVPQKVR